MKTDNELIAEFMDMKREIEYSHGVNHYEWVPRFKHSNWCFFDAPPFHTSWDWLMPVVEKISGLHDANFKYEFEEIKKGNWPKDKEYMEIIALPLSTPIDEVYKATVEFIKWYNQQSPNS